MVSCESVLHWRTHGSTHVRNISKYVPLPLSQNLYCLRKSRLPKTRLQVRAKIRPAKGKWLSSLRILGPPHVVRL